MCVYVTERTTWGPNIWLLCDSCLHPLYRNSCCSMVISDRQAAEFTIKLKAFNTTKQSRQIEVSWVNFYLAQKLEIYLNVPLLQKMRSFAMWKPEMKGAAKMYRNIHVTLSHVWNKRALALSQVLLTVLGSLISVLAFWDHRMDMPLQNIVFR